MLVAGEFWIVSLVTSADGRRRVHELLLASRGRDDDLFLEGHRLVGILRGRRLLLGERGRRQHQRGGAQKKTHGHVRVLLDRELSGVQRAHCEPTARTAQVGRDGMMAILRP